MKLKEALYQFGVNFDDEDLCFIKNIELISQIFEDHEEEIKVLNNAYQAKDKEYDDIWCKYTVTKAGYKAATVAYITGAIDYETAVNKIAKLEQELKANAVMELNDLKMSKEK